MASEPRNLLAHVCMVPDPRQRSHRNLQYHLVDVVAIAVLAVIAGADTWRDIALFGNEQQEWLETFLTLENLSGGS